MNRCAACNGGLEHHGPNGCIFHWVYRDQDGTPFRMVRLHDGGRQWVVTIHHNGDFEEFDYFTGSAITDEPTADDVLYALFMDASLIEECADHWQLAEYLGETPSRQMADTFDMITENTARLRDLLGDDYETERTRIEELNP